MITDKLLTTIGDKKIREFTLKKGNLTANIINYGGIIKSLIFDGVDVVLGYDTIDEYICTTDFYGATVGRVANRIAKGEFSLNGKEYTLCKNNGENCLHGGKEGFNKKIFDFEYSDNSLALFYSSKDMEEGFPAKLNLSVIFQIIDDGLSIEYCALSDNDTLCNITNHSFFNLNGEGSGTILNHKLIIDADKFLPTDKTQIPTGEQAPIKGGVFDFRKEHTIGERIEENDEQLITGKGYDHAYVLNGDGFRKVATLVGDKTEIVMDVLTDQKSLQLYTGNYLNKDKGKGGKLYDFREAVCLETQGYPNAINTPSFPSIVLKKGEKYYSKTIYNFKK